MNFIVAAISLGFLGSFHCIGMCGPIALSLPVHNKPPLLRYLLILSYNAGRIITYSLLGLLAGIIGRSFILAGLQQALSISVGVGLLAFVFIRFKNGLSVNPFFLWIKTVFARAFSIGRNSSLFLVGLLNGLLPCGLVYVGLAGAVATGGLLSGALFMAAFGAGTLPMMLLLPLAGSWITPSARSRMRSLVPVMITAMALFLILRGLNLGIPYLSPKINTTEKSMICHEPAPGGMVQCGRPGRKR
ncbi:MAG: sulfite exporter TauE/SafE family protein [Bacteroidota bacterium]